ncbi:MAG: hypothetical protein SVY15_08000, partial [Halobacteriota archaeon]|nr:hypothetical protein [Halobacteriota archaeon]
EDPEFISKALYFIGRRVDGEAINAVAGYYLQPDGDFHVSREEKSWMKHWDKIPRMNEAFDKIIGSEPRLKETPFVFGGNMVIHRDLYMVVPFDPGVPRGEDIDFLMNARIFGYSFFLDNQLSIKHLPPPKSHPTWRQLREDIYRFVYERSKIENQREVDGLIKITADEFDPYPGCFLKPDLEAKVEAACNILSGEYLKNGNEVDSKEVLRNIEIVNTDAKPKSNPFETLLEVQKRWQELMQYTDLEEVRASMNAVVGGD